MCGGFLLAVPGSSLMGIPFRGFGSRGSYVVSVWRTWMRDAAAARLWHL